jgi:hypothetical protein
MKMPLQYPYPERGWSNGKMRKVSDIRRGRPELEEPGIAEAAALAGAGRAARGGISADIIQQQKSQITALAQAYQTGNISFGAFGKQVVDWGWSFIGKLSAAGLKKQKEISLTAPDGSEQTLALEQEQQE